MYPTAVNLFSQSWTVSAIVAGVVYWICHKLRPIDLTSNKDDEAFEGAEKEMEAEVQTQTSSEKNGMSKAVDAYHPHS